jgi:hypothetical protein
MMLYMHNHNHLLQVVAGSNFKGRDAVLHALDHVKVERNEPCRFVALAETLGDEESSITAKVRTLKHVSNIRSVICLHYFALVTVLSCSV